MLFWVELGIGFCNNKRKGGVCGIFGVDVEYILCFYLFEFELYLGVIFGIIVYSIFRIF